MRVKRLSMLKNLQGLRGVAALFVVLAHVTQLMGGNLAQVFSFGIYGVDLFFVISGFVMVYTTTLSQATSGQFFGHRIIRIVPLYWSATILVFGVAYILPTALKSTDTDPINLIKSLFFIPYMKKGGVIQPVLFLGWTLNYEMFFYAIFAIGLFIRNAATRIFLMFAFLTALVVLGWTLSPSSVFGSFYTSPLLLEFGFGMILGYFHPRIVKHAPAAAFAGLLMIVGFAALVTGHDVFVGSAQRLQTGLAAALVIYAALAFEARGIALRSGIVMLIGAASYALYLIHPFVIGLLAKAGSRVGATHGWMVAPFMLTCIIGAIAAAIAVHLMFERPIDRALRPLRAAYAKPRVRLSTASD